MGKDIEDDWESEEQEDDWDAGPTKGKTVKYEIVDNKTKKVVGHAELSSNDYFGAGKMHGDFLGKKFSIEASGASDPQALFNKFVRWPSTQKRWFKNTGNTLQGNEEIKESSEFDDIDEMTPEAKRKLFDYTTKLIKKLNDDKGWYGGVNGTEFYNRDWKKDIAREKKRLMALKRSMAAEK